MGTTKGGSKMKNKYEERGDVTAIYVKHTHGIVETIIDTIDLPRAQEFKNSWYARWESSCNTFYVCGAAKDNGVQKSFKLHRWLTHAPKGMVVDHFDHDGLNNRRTTNLRVVTNAQNGQNRRGAYLTNKTSGVRGVHWHKGQQKWNAQLRIGYETMYLGSFDDIEEAKKVVEAARAKYMPYSQESASCIENNHLTVSPRKRNIVKQSGVIGVRWHVKNKNWQAYYNMQGKDTYIGSYDEIREAAKAIEDAKNGILPVRNKHRRSNKSGARHRAEAQRTGN
jgi:hypothetical protein